MRVVKDYTNSHSKMYTYFQMFFYSGAMPLTVVTIMTATLVPILMWCGRSAVTSARRRQATTGSVARSFMVILSTLGTLSTSFKKDKQLPLQDQVFTGIQKKNRLSF